MALLANLLSSMVISLSWNLHKIFIFFLYFRTFNSGISEALIHLHLHIGEGMGELSLADRATIANMSPEYGATMGFFPVDHVTLQYLRLTGRSDDTVSSASSSSFSGAVFISELNFTTSCFSVLYIF